MTDMTGPFDKLGTFGELTWYGIVDDKPIFEPGDSEHVEAPLHEVWGPPATA